VHFHSLNGSFRAIATVVRVVEDVSWNHHAVIRRAGGTAADTRSRLLAIIKCFQHACVGTCLWEKEVVLEYAIALDSIDYLWPIILQVLHESALRLVHQIVLVRRPTVLWVVESRCRRVRIRAVIIYVDVFGVAHEAVVLS